MPRTASRLAAFGLLALAACRFAVPAAHAAPTGDRITVTLTNLHTVVVNDRAYPVTELGKRLKKFGVTAETEVRVNIPQDTPMDLLKQMSTDLVANGIRRFFFAKPRHAEAFIVPEPAGK